MTPVEEHELRALQITSIGQEVRRRHMKWHQLPIEDVSIPCPDFEARWGEDARCMEGVLTSGANVLIHCKGGLGRAGMLAARLLVELGTNPDEAVSAVRQARPGAIETPAQVQWVYAGQPLRAAPPHNDADGLRDRAMGALVGLAVGDAVGTTLEFKPKPKYAVLDDMVGGGPFGLKAGQWTDDTSMALALADSLAGYPEFNPTNLMTRFLAWYEDGAYSCTGSCFDIGNTVRAALERFKRTDEALAGSRDPQAPGNGALMRLSPVAIRYFRDHAKLLEVAKAQTETTHGAQEGIEASILFACLLAECISGRSRNEVLSKRETRFSAKIAAIATGSSWRGRHRDEISGSGYVVDSLNAALWAVSRTTDFRSAILLAANLGEDADTTAAVTGQLAGALYGVSAIPEEWIDKLACRDKIETAAERLLR